MANSKCPKCNNYRMIQGEDLTCLYCGYIIYKISEVVKETLKRKGVILANDSLQRQSKELFIQGTLI